ncbi:hypothetical protein IID21_05140 [Patescibacteria group bacterium]|nr:hypothetical protein [Patescibacteria group bacterium]
MSPEWTTEERHEVLNAIFDALEATILDPNKSLALINLTRGLLVVKRTVLERNRDNFSEFIE